MARLLVTLAVFLSGALAGSFGMILHRIKKRVRWFRKYNPTMPDHEVSDIVIGDILDEECDKTLSYDQIEKIKKAVMVDYGKYRNHQLMKNKDMYKLDI